MISLIRRWRDRLLAVPVFHKILGLSLGIVGLFVLGLLYFTLHSLPAAFDDVLELRANSVRSLTASWLEEPERVNGDLPRALRNLTRNHHWVSGVRVHEASPEGKRVYSVTRNGENMREEGTFPDPAAVSVVGEPDRDTAYHLVIDLPPDDARAHQSRLTWTLWGIAAGTVVLGGVLATGLSWLIVTPIRRLREVTETVRDGDLTARAPILSGDEIGELTESFNIMVNRLESSLNRLQHQVQRRKDLLEQLYSAQDDERARIARELHDEIGPTLSAIRFQLDNLVEEGPRRETLLEQIQSTETQLRDLSRTLHPSTLEEGGLGEALAQFADNLNSRFVGTINLQIPEQSSLEELGNNARRTLFRVGQEALRNAVEHSGADQISLILRQDRDRVRLLVNDNGSGFNLEAEKTRGDVTNRGLGLRSMEERMSLFGGNLTIETSPGSGTLVRADIPLDKSGEDSP